MIFVVLRCKGSVFFAHVQIYLKIIKENVLFSVGLDSPSTFSFRSQKSIGFSMLQENREENRPKTLLKEKNIENTLE
jgi:hypothetical protein